MSSVCSGPMRAAGQPRAANNFDFLRLIGAVLVVYGHSYALTGAPAHLWPGFAANAIGTVGVKIFFVISGYLVAQSWLRDPHPPRFLLRRSLRIFPALVVVVLLSVAVLGPLLTTLPLSDYFGHWVTRHYFRNLALYCSYSLPGVFEKNVLPASVNGSLWSLPVEVSMYLVTPLLLSRWFNFRRVPFAALAVGLAAASVLRLRAFPPTTTHVVYGINVWAWLEVVPYFLMGAAYALYRLEWLTNIYVAFVGILALAVTSPGFSASEALLLAVLPYAVLSFGRGHAPVFDKLTGGNDLSYGIFLFGFPVQQTLVALAGPKMGPWTNSALALVVCAGLAYLSWNWVEKPMLSWKPKRRDRRPEAAAGKQDTPPGDAARAA